MWCGTMFVAPRRVLVHQQRTYVKNRGATVEEKSGEEAIKKELFPDQETFRREEQRRFEILLAHWEIPIEDVDLDQ
jgi:hypothetical protein